MPKMFEKGGPGGPGRPRGRRDTINRLLDEVASGGAEAILRRQIELAEEGDSRAAEMVLKRVWSLPRGRTVDIDLPAVTKVADVARAHAAVMSALAAREITPEEATSVSLALDAQCRAIELIDIEQRLQTVEATLGKRGARP